MKIIAKQPDLKIYWNTFSALTAYNANDLIDIKYFPSFDVAIYYNDILLDELKNLSNKREKMLQILPDIPTPKNLTGGINLGKKLNQNKNVKKVIQNYFEYSFLDNFNKYKILNNKNGFYSNLNFKIKFNSEEPTYLDFEIEYPKIEEKNLDSIFYKVYRSNDLYSIKFIIDPLIFQQCKIYSFIIFPKTINTNLTYSFVENVESNWLNSINNLKLLTVPFEDVGSIEEIKNIELNIFPLSKLQSDIFKKIKSLISQEEMLNILEEKYMNQKLQFNLTPKNITTFFQGNLYLFNNQNFSTLSWPKEDRNINGIIYNNFFPVSDFNNNKTILAAEVKPVTNDILVSIPDVDLGYYYNNNYINIENDILYFSSNNILRIEILEAKLEYNDIVLYIEFLTNLNHIENVRISSNKLLYEKKYAKLFNNNFYLAALFSFKYSLNNINSFSSLSEIDIKNIIYDQIPFEITIEPV